MSDPSVQKTAVIYSGARGGQCRTNLLCYGTPDVFLGDVAWDGHCERQELLIFAPQQGLARYLSASTFPAEASFPLPRRVQLTVWLVEPLAPDFQPEAARDEVRYANEQFASLATGLEFAAGAVNSVLASASGKIREVPATWSNESGLDPTAAAALRGDAAYVAQTINVYFVPGMLPGGLFGVTYAPDLVYVSQEMSGVAKLAHELGHALGLSHIDNLSGFRDTDHNLMVSNVASVGNISLGQIYRMHFDAASWLHGSSGTSFACQANPYDDRPCPALTLGAMEIWP